MAAQYPHASYVAGYRTWQLLGRHVRKDELPVRVVVAGAPKRSESTEMGCADERSGAVFGSTAVFDQQRAHAELRISVVTREAKSLVVGD
jgi:hypothetical protein